MQTHASFRQQSLVVLAALVGGLLTSANLTHAQPLQPEVLVSFNGTNGAGPEALTKSCDGNFYGTTFGGGDLSLNGGSGFGSVFLLTTNGLLTKLVSFSGTNGDGSIGLTP